MELIRECTYITFISCHDRQQLDIVQVEVRDRHIDTDRGCRYVIDIEVCMMFKLQI